jgi:hypothetical protein
LAMFLIFRSLMIGFPPFVCAVLRMMELLNTCSFLK